MMLEARVGERTRIARELHDTLLQSFHGLLLRFQTVDNMLPDRPIEAKERMESAIDQAAQAITEGRDAVFELRASAVEANDLVQALSMLCEEFMGREANPNSPTFTVQAQGTPRELRPVLRDEVYRIAAEASRNAIRHAQARRVEVEIRYDDRQFRLHVRDDGKGISPAILREGGSTGHYGLHGMRERAKLAGGTLDVWSKFDAGTEVELRIPASIAYAATPSRTLIAGQQAVRERYGKRFMTGERGVIRILASDDHAIFRQGIVGLIADQQDMTLVAEAANGREAIQMFRAHRPDVTLMDLQMPEMNGLDALIAIRSEFPEARIVVLNHIFQATSRFCVRLRPVPWAYLLKNPSCTRRLLDTIRAVHAGKKAHFSGGLLPARRACYR